MSFVNSNLGQNITTAVDVLLETYQNLEIFFAELDRVGEEEGFISLTPRFMRWKSDTDPSGWLTKNMIKIYQLEKDLNLSSLPDLKSGPIFGIEVDLNYKDYPIISLNRYTFDFNYWTRMPSVSEHWIFYGPFRYEDSFSIEEFNGIWTSKTYEKAKKRYWGMEEAVGIEIPLVEVTSPQSVREKIFQELLNLPK